MSRLSGLSGWIVASAAVCALFAGAAIGGPTTPAAVNGCVYNSSPGTANDGQTSVFQCDVNRNLLIAGTVTATPAGTQHVDGTGTAGTPAGGLLTVQGAASMTPVQVTPAPSALAAAGIARVKSAALESNHVIKNSAGNLYGWEVTTGAVAGWVLGYNGTSAPTAGGAAIAPEFCTIAPANSTISGNTSGDPPTYFGTGIVIVFSTSGCLTNTASSTVFISAKAS